MAVGGDHSRRQPQSVEGIYRTRRYIAALIVGVLFFSLVYLSGTATAGGASVSSGPPSPVVSGDGSNTSLEQYSPAGVPTGIRTCVRCQIDSLSVTAGP